MSPALTSSYPAVEAGIGLYATANGYAEKHASKLRPHPIVAPSGLAIPMMDDGTTNSSFPPTPDSAKQQNAMHQMKQNRFPAATNSHHQRQFRPPFEPRLYTVLKEVGDGSFGTVWLADWHSELLIPPGTLPPGPSSRPEYRGKQLVAVKRMKKAFEGGWDECMRLKELRSLRTIPEHDNIIPLYDAFLSPAKELYFVFECMEGNLYQLTKSRKGRPLASGLTASILHQMLSAINHIHAHGFFHRDIKPENLLITTTGLADYPSSSLYALPGAAPEKDVTVIVKLADFGLARETASRPPYTEYVSTRWYRAPEVLLRSRDYSNPVDMWAIGTVLVELITLKPLFPGDSEIDQVYKIISVLGDPSPDYGLDERGRLRGGGPWQRGAKLAQAVGFSFPKMTPKSLSSFFDQAVVPNQLIDLIADLLRYEPSSRLTATDCLKHPYFFEIAPRFAPLKQTAGFAINSPVTSNDVSATPSPRPVPPSHSYPSSQSQSQSQPSRPLYPSNSSAASAAEHYFGPSQTAFSNGSAPRQATASSHVTGLSGYGLQIGGTTPATQSPSLGFPETARTEHSASSLPSQWSSVPKLVPDWTEEDRPIPPFGSSLQRRPSYSGSVAASTFYDGSIFEGIAPTRAASIMSFPANPSNGAPLSPAFTSFSMARNPSQESYSPSIAQQSTFETSFGAPPQRQQAVNSSARSFVSVAPSTKSRWGLGSVFSGSSSNQVAASSSSSASKRAPSNAHQPMQVDSAPVANGDSKQSKKAAKEAERIKREAMQAASRERARAVMRKKTQLMEAADPLHSPVTNQSADAALTDKGKARASDRMSIKSGVSKMPQIVEDTSRLYVSDGRRDDDNYSISSNSTGHSSQPGVSRPASLFSQATSASDPERFTRTQYELGRASRRAPSVHSFNSATPSFYSHGPAPNTGHSSLDSQLITNMQGLATNGEGSWRTQSTLADRSESVPRAGSHHRAASPFDERSQRYTPYTLPHGINSSSSSTRNGISSAPSHSVQYAASYQSMPNLHALPGGSKSMPAGELPQLQPGVTYSTHAHVYDQSQHHPEAQPTDTNMDYQSFQLFQQQQQQRRNI